MAQKQTFKFIDKNYNEDVVMEAVFRKVESIGELKKDDKVICDPKLTKRNFVVCPSRRLPYLMTVIDKSPKFVVYFKLFNRANRCSTIDWELLWVKV